MASWFKCYALYFFDFTKILKIRKIKETLNPQRKQQINLALFA